MIPDWLAVLILFLGVGIGWVSRMRFDAEIHKDDRVVDETLERARAVGYAQGHEEGRDEVYRGIGWR